MADTTAKQKYGQLNSKKKNMTNSTVKQKI